MFLPGSKSSRTVHMDGRLEKDRPHQPVGPDERELVVLGRRHLRNESLWNRSKQVPMSENLWFWGGNICKINHYETRVRSKKLSLLSLSFSNWTRIFQYEIIIILIRKWSIHKLMCVSITVRYYTRINEIHIQYL